ncbi:YjfA family protein [Thermoactinomyces sp. DSM 45892]|uniref:YjfA family protein n=1 Tax=Thermoactinomyces sp. DSM 45892 TaxID=1882753 RepID=UPI000B88E011|nr:YjfA family protein [Thermoactinomyces sp. DSM 45892]
MFLNKKIFFLSLVYLFTGSFTSNLEVFAENHHYDGKSPSYNYCDRSVETKRSSYLKGPDNSNIGIVELRFSNACKTAWARITMFTPIAWPWKANTFITRNTDGKRFSCESAGGNGEVINGQTFCYTPMVYDLDPRTSYASGMYYLPNSGAVFHTRTDSY